MQDLPPGDVSSTSMEQHESREKRPLASLLTLSPVSRKMTRFALKKKTDQVGMHFILYEFFTLPESRLNWTALTWAIYCYTCHWMERLNNKWLAQLPRLLIIDFIGPLKWYFHLFSLCINTYIIPSIAWPLQKKGRVWTLYHSKSVARYRKQVTPIRSSS